MTEPTAPGWPDWVEQWILPYVTESALWPVLAAVLGHVSLVFALAILMAARSLNPLALGAVGWLLVTSGMICRFELRHLHRPGGVTLTVAATWAGAVVIAWIGWRTGIL